MSTISKESFHGYEDEEDSELRRGPWTLDEDSLLVRYIACHGEGRWDMLAKCSGLRRTGKSCRLRWLNYLKPDIKRGNLSLEEQILILQLHSKWGNRWSRIAQHLPGRTDNEIKNYWRTRVQKHARQLKMDANSTRFREVIQCFWMPRLIQKIEENSRSSVIINAQNSPAPPLPRDQEPPPRPPPQEVIYNHDEYNSSSENHSSSSPSICISSSEYQTYNPYLQGCDLDAFNLDPLSYDNMGPNSQLADNLCVNGEMSESLWNMDELWQFTKLQESNM